MKIWLPGQRKKKSKLIPAPRIVKNYFDFKARLWCSSCCEVTPHQGWSLRLFVWCGRRWRQSLLGSSSWGQRAGGEAAHCTKIELILLIFWSFLSCTDSVAGQIPLLSFLVHLRLFSHCYWELEVSKSQGSGEVSSGSTFPGQGGRESGETTPCGSKPLDQIKLSHVTSLSVFCGSELCSCPVFLPAHCLTATS